MASSTNDWSCGQFLSSTTGRIMATKVAMPFCTKRWGSLTYLSRSRALNSVCSSWVRFEYKLTIFLLRRTAAIWRWPSSGLFTRMYVKVEMDDLCLVYALRVLVEYLIFSLSPERVCLMSYKMSLALALLNWLASTYILACWCFQKNIYIIDLPIIKKLIHCIKNILYRNPKLITS